MPREIKAYLVHSTDRAILVKNSDGEQVWIPKSQVEDLIIDGDTVSFSMHSWKADLKKLV